MYPVLIHLQTVSLCLFLAAWLDNRSLFPETMYQANHLDRIFQKNLIGIDHKTAVPPINAISFPPLITASVTIRIPPVWKTERIGIMSVFSSPFNDGMLRQPPDFIPSGNVSGKPDPVTSMQKKAEEKSAGRDYAVFQKLMQLCSRKSHRILQEQFHPCPNRMYQIFCVLFQLFHKESPFPKACLKKAFCKMCVTIIFQTCSKPVLQNLFSSSYYMILSSTRYHQNPN